MTPTRITGRHVLFGLLGFFGLVFAANGAFIFLALDSFSGLSTENAYQRGLDYNETLRAAETQRALGWRVAVTSEALGAGRHRIAVDFLDKRGAPLDDLAVDGSLRRPTQDGQDRPIALARVAPGRYAVDVSLPLAGQWDLVLAARSPAGWTYRLEERLWLK
jgi:nitrogen fixation protein FixH